MVKKFVLNSDSQAGHHLKVSGISTERNWWSLFFLQDNMDVRDTFIPAHKNNRVAVRCLSKQRTSKFKHPLNLLRFSDWQPGGTSFRSYKYMDRCSLQKPSRFSEPEATTSYFCSALQTMGNPTVGPVCIQIINSATSVPHQAWSNCSR